MRTLIAAVGVFVTATFVGALHAGFAMNAPQMAADRPFYIHETGVARFVTTDTGVARFYTTDTPGQFRLSVESTGGSPSGRQVVVDGLGVARFLSTDADNTRLYSVDTPSKWIVEVAPR